MRIIVCGPGYQGKYRDFFYSLDKKLINGLIRAGHSVIPLSDREITRTLGGMRALGRIAVERHILHVARSYEPELLALFQADQVSNSMLRAFKEEHPTCPIVNIDCDPICFDEKAQRLIARRGFVDATLVTTAGAPLERLRSEGLRSGFMPNATDASVENADAFAYDGKFFDLIYISGMRKATSRWDIIRMVAQRASDLSVGSFGADKKKVLGQDYFNVLKRSRCALNWSVRNDVHLYSSDRISQLFGAGACVCMPRSSGYDMFLADTEAVFFADIDDLIGRLRHIKATEEWKEIARAGRDKYRALFNETRVARYILDFVFEAPLEDYEWGAL
jgi:hypothetical protein